jgi:hypothetical protein
MWKCVSNRQQNPLLVHDSTTFVTSYNGKAQKMFPQNVLNCIVVGNISCKM